MGLNFKSFWWVIHQTFANFDVLATGVAGTVGASAPADSFGPGPGGASAPGENFGPGPGGASAPADNFGPGPGFTGAMPGPAPGPGRPWTYDKICNFEFR